MKIVLLDEHARMPTRATPDSAAFDLSSVADRIIRPDETILIPTGLQIELSVGTAGLVCPRSGLALHHYLTIPNAPGIIDSDYRGEVGVLLMNLGSEPFHVDVGTRIAQLLIVPAIPVAWQEVPRGGLSTTDRGCDGFGSTGH